MLSRNALISGGFWRLTAELLLFVALHAELGDALDELWKAGEAGSRGARGGWTRRGRARSPLKSTSPFPSVSKMSMTLCTSGFCCSSGSDMNSSTLSEPELSRSSFLNLFPSLLISSASTATEHRGRDPPQTPPEPRLPPPPQPGPRVLLSRSEESYLTYLTCSCLPGVRGGGPAQPGLPLRPKPLGVT